MSKRPDPNPFPRDGKPAGGSALGQQMLAVLLRKGTWPMYGFYKEAIQGIQRVAFSRGYGLFVVNPPPERDVAGLRLMDSLKSVSSGIVLVAPEDNAAFFEILEKEHFPSVILYRDYPNLNYVQVDNEGGARSATDHLIGLGHKRIAHLGGPEDAVDARHRLNGYKTALQKRAIPFQENYVIEAGFDQSKAFDATKVLLKQKPSPTAIFAANDYMALGAIAAVRDEGLSVPGHVAVVGFDDIVSPSLAFRAPSLTTVRQPVYEIAKEGTEMVILNIEGRIEEKRHTVFPSQLIVRTTCGAQMSRRSTGLLQPDEEASPLSQE